MYFNRRLFPAEVCFPIFFHLAEKCFWIFLCWTKQLFLAFKVFQIWLHSECFSFLEALKIFLEYTYTYAYTYVYTYAYSILWVHIHVLIEYFYAVHVHIRCTRTSRPAHADHKIKVQAIFIQTSIQCFDGATPCDPRCKMFFFTFGVIFINLTAPNCTNLTF